MDTESAIIVRSDDFEPKIPSCFKNNIEIVEKLILCERTVSDLKQLFEVFLWNVNQLDRMRIWNDDRIHDAHDHTMDPIVVNAMTQNVFISSVTLINEIEAYLQDIDENYTTQFKQLCSEKYENSFYYRLATLIRNYSVHGHLSVSFDGERFCFDLRQILGTPHFNLKDKYKEEFKKIIDTTIDRYNFYPRISYTLTIADYIPTVIKLYSSSLEMISAHIHKVYDSYQKLINDNSEEIASSSIGGQCIAYKSENNELHVISISSDLVREFEEQQVKAEALYTKYKQRQEDILGSGRAQRDN